MALAKQFNTRCRPNFSRFPGERSELSEFVAYEAKFIYELIFIYKHENKVYVLHSLNKTDKLGLESLPRKILRNIRQRIATFSALPIPVGVALSGIDPKKIYW